MTRSSMKILPLDPSDQAVVAIPARIGSTRLPRKVLLEINGKPMLHHVIERSQKAELVTKVFVITDNEEVFESVGPTGAKALMSDPECSSGTARIASVIDQLPGGIIINVQADQPVVEPKLIDGIIQKLVNTEADISTPIWQIQTTEQLSDASVVKVVCGHQGEALYFSRSPVPYIRDRKLTEWLDVTEFWGHHGIYGFRRDILKNFDSIPSGRLEDLEKLEQLRFLEAGYCIRTFSTSYKHLSVDNPEDLKFINKLVQST